MNVLVIAKYAGNPNPATIFIHDQVKALRSLGHEVYVIVPKPYLKDRSKNKPGSVVQMIDDVPYLIPSYLSLSNLGEYSFNNYTFHSAVRSALKVLSQTGFKPDIVHGHTFSAPSYSAVKLKQALDIPALITTHGNDLRIPMEQGKSDYITRRAGQLDGVIAVSGVQQQLLKSLDPSIPSKVIINGFNLLEKDAYDKEAGLITAVGNLRDSKNFDVLIKSFAEIHKEVPESRLQIIGSGPLEESLKRLISDLNLGSNVLFLGQLSNRQVLEEMNRSQIFALPSVREGFGIVYLEAMSQKCLVIATKAEGFATIAQDGINCYLVEPNSVEDLANKLLKGLRDPAASQIAQAGFELALSHTWLDNGRETNNYYQDTLVRSKSHHDKTESLSYHNRS